MDLHDIDTQHEHVYHYSKSPTFLSIKKQRETKMWKEKQICLVGLRIRKQTLHHVLSFVIIGLTALLVLSRFIIGMAAFDFATVVS